MKILIVDDQRSARRALIRVLERLGDTEFVEAESLAAARALLAPDDIDVAFVDLRLDDDIRNRDGLALLGLIRAQFRAVPIVVSGANDMAEIRAAMRAGAYDYVVKDELSDELVLPIMEELRNKRQLEREVLKLRARSAPDAICNLVGTSQPMQRLREMIHRVSVSARPVLVLGPTGAGKEVVVRAIHALGAHPDHPLLDLNCGAFPESLIESQLFGHEKGAFTGAESRHDGFFTAVRRGTLFLDEIAELPLELQAKLLRALETNTFRPVGSATTKPFEGRVIAATHADLEERVAQGRFRQDLYYRLNVLEVTVPSLEERRDDIPALLAHFATMQPRPLQFTLEAVRLIQEMSWPGNVRQLRNFVDRLAVFAPDACVTPEVIAQIPGRGRTQVSTASVGELARAVLQLPDQDKLKVMENMLLDEALRMAGGSKTAAAQLLGVHRKVVERRLQRGGEPSN